MNYFNLQSRTHSAAFEASGQILIERLTGGARRAEGLDGEATARSPVESVLLAHRIPEGLTEEMLSALFLHLAYVCPVEVQPIEWTTTEAPRHSRKKAEEGKVGKSRIYFSSPEHADLALNTMPGPLRNDLKNRAQKRIYMKNGGYLYLRKL